MADEDELPSDLLASMNSLDKTLLGCDEILQTLTKVPLQDSKNKLEALESAKLDLTATYAINSLFWIYLVTQGVNATDHPVKHELDRIKKYMTKVRDTEAKVKGASMKLDKQAAKRFVASALQIEKDDGKQETPKKTETPKEIEATPVEKTNTKSSKRKPDERSSTKKKKKKSKQD